MAVPLYQEKDFEDLTAKLKAHIIATTAAFALKHSIGTLRVGSLVQMSADITNVAQELLMFGLDAWPLATTEENVVALPIASPELAIEARPLTKSFG
jgi:hypothetical protein